MSRPFGLFVKRDGFQGWQGISSRRREALARAVAHGEHDVPVYLGSRVVTIDGWALGKDEEDLGNRVNSVVGIGSDGRRVRPVIKHLGKLREADGRVLIAEADDSGGRSGVLRASFQLQFVFADPRKYGGSFVLPGDRLFPVDRAATATSIVVMHHGNFSSFPVVEIPSAPASYVISSPGGTFTVTGATAGGTHRVHLRNGRVYRNGVEMPGVGRGDLWAVPADAGWTHTLSVAGRVYIDDVDI
ncbi:hypothetical protein [uncultured Microbacterium sp.]|uniref:hypothetical protein n=1 Tax=uncultured Microbacterium sp. TaxID=191216 RepID=UPI0025FD91C0|nr:hypothetical protein [uncultured Microbacterium sp.]